MEHEETKVNVKVNERTTTAYNYGNKIRIFDPNEQLLMSIETTEAFGNMVSEEIKKTDPRYNEVDVASMVSHNVILDSLEELFPEGLERENYLHKLFFHFRLNLEDVEVCTLHAVSRITFVLTDRGTGRVETFACHVNRETRSKLDQEFNLDTIRDEATSIKWEGTNQTEFYSPYEDFELNRLERTYLFDFLNEKSIIK